MVDEERPHCRHCGVVMKKWRAPDNSTWAVGYQWVCFNDECPYFVRGWDHIMKTQQVTASYRYRLDPETEAEGPLPCWSYDAHKDKIID